MNKTEMLQWLRWYGHHRPIGIAGKNVALAKQDELAGMISSAQKSLKIIIDGIAGPQTIAAMKQPRCGCPDHIWARGSKLPKFYESCSMAVGVYTDWSGIRGITESRADEIMRANFDMLRPFNIRMKLVRDISKALINIRMGNARQGVLAWAELGEGCDWQRQSLFNIDVDWSDELLFGGTGSHEICGHCAGVGHAELPDSAADSIMEPVYDPNVQNTIDPWFAAQLEKRYGLSNVDNGGGPVEPDPIDPQKPDDPKGVKGMNWQAIIAILIPIIQKCIEEGASNDQIDRAIRNPNSRQRRRMERGVKRFVVSNNPGMGRKSRRIRVDALMDCVISRGSEASKQEMTMVIQMARQS